MTSSKTSLLAGIIDLICKSYEIDNDDDTTSTTKNVKIQDESELIELKSIISTIEDKLQRLKGKIENGYEKASETSNTDTKSHSDSDDNVPLPPTPNVGQQGLVRSHSKREGKGIAALLRENQSRVKNSAENDNPLFMKDENKLADKSKSDQGENEIPVSHVEATPKVKNPRRESRKMSYPFLSPASDSSDNDEEDEGRDEAPQMKRSAFNILPSFRRPSIHPGSVRMSMLQTPTRPLKEKVMSEEDRWKNMAKDAFNIIDDNGDGFLQKEEVVSAMKMMEENGMDFNAHSGDYAEIAEKMMKEVDKDGDGLIDIDEFIDMMKKNVPDNSSNSFSASSFLSYNHRMSQLARNVLLAHQKKLENSVIGEDLWLIHPFSNFHLAWDMMISVLILLTVITTPFFIGWDDLNQEFFAMNLTVDILFLFDVVKNFFTGIVNENDAVIMDRRIVTRSYLTGFFVPDFCGSIPLDLIFRLSGVDNVSAGGAVSSTKNTLKLLRTLRLAKLFRLFRISRLFQHVKDLFLWVEEKLNIRISDGFTKLLRLGVGALVLGHWIGCFNFFLVRLYEFPEDSWVVYAGLEDKDAYTQWTWSFFKALAQMIMIGFETPPFTNASCDTASHWCGIEYWVTLGCLYLGAVFYSLLISSISSILQTANLASRHFEEKLMELDDYMRNKKLPAAMREKVKDCFHLQHANGKLYDEGELLDMLTPILKREIKLFTGRDLTVKVPLFSTVVNKEFAEEMATMIEPMISFQNEVVLREKTTGEDMFFIGTGVVEIYLAGAQNTAYVAIGDGCYFGEVSPLLGIRRTASARTKTQCMLFRISKEKLISVLQDFPRTLETMVKVAESRHRRLNHYIDPSKYELRTEDEVDSEDCKTELFGADAEKVVSEKEETMRTRLSGRQSHRYRGTLIETRKAHKKA